MRNAPAATGRRARIRTSIRGACVAPFDEAEDARTGQERRPAGAGCLRRSPSGVSRLDQAVDERGGRARWPAIAPGRSTRRPCAGGAGANRRGSSARTARPTGMLTKNTHSPAGSRRQGAADERARRESGSAERRPDAECLVTFGAVKEPGDGGQRRRGQQRRAHPLGDPAADQHRPARGEPGDQRGEHEQRQAGQQRCGGRRSASAEPPAEEHEAAETQRVRGDRPGELTRGRAAGRSRCWAAPR